MFCSVFATDNTLKSLDGSALARYRRQQETRVSRRGHYMAISRPRMDNIVHLEQVDGALGAGRQVFWRRCDFWGWTCATPGRRVVICGAGHHAFSTPAPLRAHTCANKRNHPFTSMSMADGGARVRWCAGYVRLSAAPPGRKRP